VSSSGDQNDGLGTSESGPGNDTQSPANAADEKNATTDDAVGVGTDTQTGSTRDLLSARPFVRAAKLWRDAGWLGTIPLPARSKNPPPTGWTGRNAGFPDNAQISAWAKLAQYKKGNIGLHLGWSITIDGTEYEVVGIDVDDYEDNGKIKEGAKQLRALEDQLGPLPRTYVSTARASRGDFNSGIRFYLVPRGLAFRGQVDKDIEVIQKSHRFAVVWPSYNPKSDSQYCLYSADEFFGPVGAERNRVGGSQGGKASGQRLGSGSENGTSSQPTPSHVIPHVTSLPFLPRAWLDYLTNGQMQDADGGIDMESTPKEIEDWANEQFNDPDDVCVYMARVRNKWKQRINDEATSHDKVRNAHWEIINCAAEGHTGWNSAIDAIDEHWINDVMARSKRSVQEMRGELFRSKINSVRKVKVKVENATSAGGVYTPDACVCAQRAAITGGGGVVATMGGDAGGLFVSDSELENDSSGPPDALDFVSWGNGNSPDDYDLNDDGNGEFLCDLLRYKSGRVKWVEGYGWIVWTDGTPERPSRWLHDEDGLIRRAFWRVKRHQEHFAEQKQDEANNLWMQTGRITPMPPDVKAAFALAKRYGDWATRSGNNRQAEAAINAAKNFSGVSMDINELNKNPYLLGVANGVVELRSDGAVLRDANADDFVTLNTGVEWHGDYSGLRNTHGYKLWEEYLDRFIPESRRQDFQTILGYCILGGNEERLMLVLLGGTSTGKSTMLRALGAAMGDYASTVTLTIFENHKLNPALANAMPKRMVFTSELSAGDQLSVASVKRMTGNDIVMAELKGSNIQVAGIPQYVPIMATNTAPEIKGADEALRKRLMVLLFDQRIEDRKDEKGAAFELEQHASEAILAWLIEGFVRYREMGIPKNIEIKKATDDFSSQLDPVNEFIGECTRPGSDDAHVPLTAMYAAYEKWCAASNVDRREILSSQKFSRRLVGMGIVKSKSTVEKKQQWAWKGILLTKTAQLRNQQISSVSDIKLNTESGDSK